MKTEEISVSNISCDGCARSIKNGLSALKGVKNVEVNKETKIVKISYDEIERNNITSKLDELGYPEVSKQIN